MFRIEVRMRSEHYFSSFPALHKQGSQKSEEEFHLEERQDMPSVSIRQ
jgi:hypothetical protein